MKRWEIWLRFAGLMLALAAAFPPAHAQKKEKEWKPVTVPADVLEYGARLEEAASPALKEWVAGHVSKNLHEKPLDPAVTINAVDAKFPTASDQARDAGIFLAYFTAYRDDMEGARVLLFRIREIDRQVDEITRTMSKEWQREQNLAAAGRPPTPTSLERREESERKTNDQLRDLRDERETKLQQLEFTRKKVDLYLKILANAYRKMKGTPTAILAELK